MAPFRDEYTNFTFNGTTSEQMKVWITNSRDIQFRLTPEFSDTFVSPAFANNNILTGTNITKSTFSLKCIAIDITMHEWRAIQQWLSPYVVGRLEFDFNLDTYYNAKISKSITGTSFIKGSSNHVLGDVYIVEFSIEFTTVDDFAALGIVNVGILGQDITGNIGNTSYSYLPSVSNNKFFMPMAVKMQTAITRNASYAPVYSIGGQEVKVKWEISAIPNEIQVLAYIITPNGLKEEGYYFAEYEINFQSNDKKIYLYGSSDGKERSVKLQELLDLTDWDFSNENVPEFELKLYGDNLFITTINNNIELTVSSDLDDYAICNTGSYEMYPTILTKTKSGLTSITIQKDGEIFYEYSYNTTLDNPYLTFDGQHGLALSGDTLAEQAYIIKTINNTDVKEKMFGSSIVNRGVLSIPSGCPELLRCKIISDPIALDIGDTETPKLLELYSVTIKTSTPLQYNHSRSILHLFTEVAANSNFNTTPYPYYPLPTENNNKLYISKFYNSHVLKRSFIIPKDDDSYIIIGPSSEIKNFVKDEILYLSICDYTLLNINADGFIYLQSRDAF